MTEYHCFCKIDTGIPLLRSEFLRCHCRTRIMLVPASSPPCKGIQIATREDEINCVCNSTTTTTTTTTITATSATTTITANTTTIGRPIVSS